MRHNFSMIQCLFNAGEYSEKEIQNLLRQAEKDESVVARMLPDAELDTRPVRTAVLQAARDGYPEEIGFYSDYMELFMDSLRDLIGMEAVVSCEAELAREPEPAYAVSQNINGDFNLTIGIIASEPMYLEIARRYSGEELTTVDDMAVDSVEEFLNVINGLFCIEQANQKTDAELDIPHSGKDIHPCGSHQLCLRIYTAVGSFQAVLAADEFLQTAWRPEGALAGILF